MLKFIGNELIVLKLSGVWWGMVMMFVSVMLLRELINLFWMYLGIVFWISRRIKDVNWRFRILFVIILSKFLVLFLLCFMLVLCVMWNMCVLWILYFLKSFFMFVSISCSSGKNRCSLEFLLSLIWI